MAGFVSPEFKTLVKLNEEGWRVINMTPYEPNIGRIGKWCNETLGDMMSVYDFDFNSRWYGALVTINSKAECYFAFRDERDFTMFTLRWS